MKADQKARGRYLGGKVRFLLGESGELVPHEAAQEAIREIVALRARGKPLRAIADTVRAKGRRISDEGMVLRLAKTRRLSTSHHRSSRAETRRPRQRLDALSV
jgi:hypothetical protein